MSKENIEISADEFLFGKGLRLEDYFIEQTPVSEVLCYRDAGGRNFDLPISNERLAAAVMARLRELGVRIVRLDV